MFLSNQTERIFPENSTLTSFYSSFCEKVFHHQMKSLTVFSQYRLRKKKEIADIYLDPVRNLVALQKMELSLQLKVGYNYMPYFPMRINKQYKYKRIMILTF